MTERREKWKEGEGEKSREKARERRKREGLVSSSAGYHVIQAGSHREQTALTFFIFEYY